MNSVRYRKYPRVHNKKSLGSSEKELTISAITAVGILAFTFAKGMLWGYLLKKQLD